MWFSFVAGGYCSAVALYSFLNENYITGTCMTLLSILNITLGVMNL